MRAWSFLLVVVSALLSLLALPGPRVAASDFTASDFTASDFTASDFTGAWGLTSPSGGAVWLKVEVKPARVNGWLMWEIGGVNEIQEIRVEGDTLIIEQPCYRWYMSAQGMRRDKLGSDTLRATVVGDLMTIGLKRVLSNGTRLPSQSMSGKRAQPMPPKPDVAALQFGSPMELFNGNSLVGWQLTDPNDNNAWSAKDGILINNPQLEDGENPKQFGNLRTVREFEDFRLQLEVRLPNQGNSGIYLRGRYEVQVTDAYGRKPSWGILGGVYSRIVPLENAAKPAGQWQRFDIILADRYVTVRLNERLVIDNQFLEGCTGGALDSDDEKTGPIYFQGDHTFIEYRNIVLFPRLR